MAAAEGQASLQSQPETWHGVVLETLKRNDVRLVPYVPDRVLTTLIKNLHADPFFTTFPAAREEEAVGIVSGAWMGRMRGAVLMHIAQGCGLADSAWAADEEDFEPLVDQSLIATAPTLIALRIADKPGVGTTDRDPVQVRQRFMLGLGVRHAV
jgi:hypothetical protein